MVSEAAAVAGAAGASARAKRVDPLVLLKQHVIRNQKVNWSEGFLEFEGERIHANTKCAFRLSPQEQCIDIGSVWYMLRETSGDQSYTQESAKKRGFTYIGVLHRGYLCDFLLGKTATCAGLVKDVIEGRKRLRDDPDADLPLGMRKEAKPGSAAGQRTIGSDDISYADVAARMRPVKDLDVLVRCPGRMVPNADLILKIAQDEWKNWAKPHKNRPLALNESARPAGKIPFCIELEEILRNDPEKNPIILLPCSKSAPVNLLNAADLLQHGVYKKPDEEHTRFFESTRPEAVFVSRNIKGKMWTFEIRDSAQKFTRDQWMRTVAIVTDGYTWEFKGLPFETIIDMFATVKGIYFKPSGLDLPLQIDEWAVTPLHLAPLHLVHRFPQLRDDFFSAIEEWMDSSRQRKFVNHTTLELGKQLIIKPKPIL